MADDVDEKNEHQLHNASGIEKEQPSFADPHTLPFWRKCTITALLAGVTFTVTFCSSIFSATIPVTAAEFHSTETVMILGVSLYVLGFSLGPLFWGPVSETLGRRIPTFSGYLVFALIQIPTALVHNLPGLLILRFLAGTFGAAPLAVVTATYADFWAPAARGIASAIYALVCFVGPCLGPILGVYITENLSWRWTAWITLIMAAFFGLPAYFFVPETYVPILRGDSKPSRQDFVTKYLIRPALMLWHEPLLYIMTIYTSLVYGIQYLTFYSIPYTFAHRPVDPFSHSTSSLPFLSMLLGITTASVCVSIYYTKYYTTRLRARGSILAEDRLPPVMIGSLLLPIGLFILAWTSSVHWIVQLLAVFLIGAGIMLIFAVGLVYIIDIYLSKAASALAANTCIRSAVACGLPLAAPKMFNNLGVEWATTLLALLTTVLVPAPFLFYRYGHKLRENSRFAES